MSQPQVAAQARHIPPAQFDAARVADVFRTETGGRTIAVHSAGILEALRSIYQAEALVAELPRASR